MTDKIRVPLSQPWINDLIHERDELRAQFNQYVRGAEVEASELRAENERLRAEVDMWHRHYAGLLNEAHDENERLRAALAEACDEIESWVDSDDETTTAWRHLLARDMEC